MLHAAIASVSASSIFLAGFIAPRAFSASWKKQGGLRFFRIGRFGGSFYLAKRKAD